MVVCFPLSVALYVEHYLEASARVLREVIPASQDVKAGFCRPPGMVVDSAEAKNPQNFELLNRVEIGDHSLASVLKLMFDKWMEKVLVDVLAYVKDSTERKLIGGFPAKDTAGLMQRKSEVQLIEKLTAASANLRKARDLQHVEEQTRLLGTIAQLSELLYTAQNLSTASPFFPDDSLSLDGQITFPDSEALGIQRTDSLIVPQSLAPKPASLMLVCAQLQYDGWLATPQHNRAVFQIFEDTLTSLFRNCGGVCFLPGGGEACAVMAFPNPTDAVEAALEIQAQLLAAEWPPALLEASRYPPEYREGKPDTDLSDCLWRGPRCRVALHYSPYVEGLPHTLHQYKLWHGPDLHIVAKLCGVANGGETLITSPARRQIIGTKSHASMRALEQRRRVVFSLLHRHLRLRNVPTAVTVWRLTERRLLPRSYAPARPLEAAECNRMLEGLLVHLDYFTGWSMPTFPLRRGFVLQIRVENFVTLCSMVSSAALEESLQLLYDTVRQAVVRHGGFELLEVVAEPDTMVAVFQEAGPALRAALTIQKDLHCCVWPDDVCALPHSFWRPFGSSGLRHESDRKAAAAFNGLRARIGVVEGALQYSLQLHRDADHVMETETDLRNPSEVPVLEGVTAERASALCELAQGGEVVTTHVVCAEAGLPDEEASFRPLVGSDEPPVPPSEMLYSVLPPELKSRTFERAYLLNRMRAPGTPEVTVPVLPSVKPLPIGFTANVVLAVEHGLFLQTVAPTAFSAAVAVLEAAVEKIAVAFGGYVALRTQGTFHVAFADVADSVRFCNAVQDNLMYQSWNPAILRYAEASVELSPTGQQIQRGLRVKAGITCGEVQYLAVPTDSGMSTNVYYGEAISLAAHLCETCPVGATVVSHGVYRLVYHHLGDILSDCVVEPITPAELGITDSAQKHHMLSDGPLFVVLPAHLRERWQRSGPSSAKALHSVRERLHPSAKQRLLHDGAVVSPRGTTDTRRARERMRVGALASSCGYFSIRTRRQRLRDVGLSAHYFATLRRWLEYRNSVCQKGTPEQKQALGQVHFDFESTTGELLVKTDEEMAAYLLSVEHLPCAPGMASLLPTASGVSAAGGFFPTMGSFVAHSL
eukprot:RCo027841